MKIEYPSDEEIYLQKLIEDIEESEKSINLLLEIGGLILMNEVEKVKPYLFSKQKYYGNKQK